MSVDHNQDTVRVYVGADRSQALAVQVLAHSIRRHASLPVEVIPMIDLPVPTPVDPRNGQRTGFSFSRFCIPRLAGSQGKAVYMDADLLVFRDIRALWELPFDGAKAIIQREVKHQEETTAKQGAPKARPKQCSVMLLDCARLDWDIAAIVAAMDRGDYDYEALMYHLCLLEEHEVSYGVPFEWNSLEYRDADTCLIHYTDVYTQPWTACGNVNGHWWFDEVRLMLATGALSREALQQEIDLGYFRPSLWRDLAYRHRLPGFALGWFDRLNRALDRIAGYVPHKDVYEAKRRRKQAIAAHLAMSPQADVRG